MNKLNKIDFTSTHSLVNKKVTRGGDCPKTFEK